MNVSADQVTSVLAGVSYPARLWQIAAWAEHNGAAHPVREALLNLPTRDYEDDADVARAVLESRPGTVAPLRQCHHKRHPRNCCGNDWHYQLDDLAG